MLCLYCICRTPGCFDISASQTCFQPRPCPSPAVPQKLNRCADPKTSFFPFVKIIILFWVFFNSENNCYLTTEAPTSTIFGETNGKHVGGLFNWMLPRPIDPVHEERDVLDSAGGRQETSWPRQYLKTCTMYECIVTSRNSSFKDICKVERLNCADRLLATPANSVLCLCTCSLAAKLERQCLFHFFITIFMLLAC